MDNTTKNLVARHYIKILARDTCSSMCSTQTDKYFALKEVLTDGIDAQSNPYMAIFPTEFLGGFLATSNGFHKRERAQPFSTRAVNYKFVFRVFRRTKS